VDLPFRHTTASCSPVPGVAIVAVRDAGSIRCHVSRKPWTFGSGGVAQRGLTMAPALFPTPADQGAAVGPPNPGVRPLTLGNRRPSTTVGDSHTSRVADPAS